MSTLNEAAPRQLVRAVLLVLPLVGISSQSSDCECILGFLVFGHFSSNQETLAWDNCAIAGSRI